MIYGNDELRRAFAQIRREQVFSGGPLVCFCERQDQRRTRVLMPDFCRIDLMPMAAFTFFQQKIDAGAIRSRLSVVDVGLAIPAALRVRLEI